MTFFNRSSAEPPPPGFEGIHRFFDPREGKTLVKILPGEFYVSSSDRELIVTTLGSCVSVCIRDPRAGIGGMNHFMLPDGPGSGSSTFSQSANSYGVFAMESLINSLIKQGGRRSRFELKVTGGGLIGSSSSSIGQCNSLFIKEFLEIEKLRPVSVDLGGITGRKVHYDPVSGKLMVKKLASLHGTNLVEQETRYSESLGKVTAGGEVELF